MRSIEKVSFVYVLLMLTITAFILGTDLNDFSISIKVFMFFVGFISLLFSIEFIAKSLQPNSLGLAVGAATVIPSFIIIVTTSLIADSFTNQIGYPKDSSQLLLFILILIKNGHLIMLGGACTGLMCQFILNWLESPKTPPSRGVS